MKVLIVDDSDDKVVEVSKVLEAILSPNLQMDRARSYTSALGPFTEHCYDLLILDLRLPMRDGEDPSDDMGLKILNELRKSDDLKTPSHIICLTEFESCFEKFKFESQRHLYHSVKYSASSEEWKKQLTSKIVSIEKNSIQRFLFASYEKDILIVTSSPHVELSEVLKQGDFGTAEFSQQDSLYYYPGKWKSAEKELSVVACAAPSMGMVSTCATSIKAIQRWKPKFIVMSGIAAGISKKFKFGDILTASAVFDYGSGKIKDEGQTRSFIPDPNYLPADQKIEALLQKWERDQPFMDEIRRQWHSPSDVMPKLIVGPIASGAAVVQSPSLVASILANSRKVVGIDMEAYAIFSAARLSPNPKPLPFVAKSISDFADSKKKDDWQQYAAYTSAAFIYKFFTQEPELWS